MGKTRDQYEEAIRLYNAGDLDGFADTHVPDAVLVTPAGTFEGRPAILQYWTGLKAAFPDLHLTLHLVIEQGDAVASEWTWVGTNRGPLVLRDGSHLPPTGRRIEITGMELAILREGKIAQYRMYWDGASFAQQLGLTPRQPVRPDAGWQRRSDAAG
jgi:predicted ester cyclase